jgi:hypothetical protein
MGCERAILKAVHSLTLVQRAVVFRPSPSQTTNALGTQVVFRTNELMHVITSVWPNIESIKRSIDYWHHELMNIAARMPQQDKLQISRVVQVAMRTLNELVESSDAQQAVVLQ